MSTRLLKRYTNLTAAIYLLRKRSITLLDPRTWDDRNDSYYLKIYRDRLNLKSVLALCFTQAPETYHHWRVFANGSDGVRIEFHRDRLLNVVAGTQWRSGDVEYRTRSEMRSARREISELPFLKRYAFRHDSEFRMIYESRTKSVATLDVKIPLSCIHKITLSPWLRASLSGSVIKNLKSIRDCSTLEVVPSTLINNDEWKALGDAIVAKQH